MSARFARYVIPDVPVSCSCHLALICEPCTAQILFLRLTDEDKEFWDLSSDLWKLSIRTPNGNRLDVSPRVARLLA